MLWLALHIRALPLAVWDRHAANPVRARPATTHEHPAGAPPVAITGRGTVCCANAAAQAQGVQAGMSAATAGALCGQLLLRERDVARERALLATLAHDLRRYTPQVCTGGDGEGDCVLLEIAGSLRLFHGLDALLSRVDATLDGHGLACDRALARTPGAAALLARAAHDTRALVDDHGQIDHPGLQRALAALPVAALGLDARTEDSLMNMGLARFGELDALPRAALARRFGKAFALWLDRVTGAAPDLRAPLPAETFFVRELHFLDGIADTQTLLFPMQRLLGQFGGFLRQHQLATQQLVWRCTGVDRRTQDIVITTARPEMSPARFLALTRVRLESVRLEAPVETLRLACRRYTPLAARAAQLFPELDAGRNDDEFGALLDRLRLRLGDARCRQWLPLDSARPEAQRNVPAGSADGFPVLLPAGAQRRPLWLLRAPQRADWRDGRLYWHGELDLLDGPERIDSDWWTQPVRRDYFTARHTGAENAGENRYSAGALYWVYRDHADDAWYVHGLFG